MTKPRAIVFDLDGTLVDSLPLTFAAFHAALAARGLPPATSAEIASHFGRGEREIFGRMLGEERAEEAFVAYREHFAANLGEAPLFEGVLEVLGRLRARGLALAVFTSRGWSTTELILRHHGLLERFGAVVAYDHVKSPKPSPEGLRLALRRLGVPPEAAWMVGDSPLDLAAARAAGSVGIGAAWDRLADRAALAAADPRALLESPDELDALLDSLD